MLHHNLAYGLLAAVYAAIAAVLVSEEAFVHAICAAAVALIYVFMSSRHPTAAPDL